MSRPITYTVGPACARGDHDGCCGALTLDDDPRWGEASNWICACGCGNAKLGEVCGAETTIIGTTYRCQERKGHEGGHQAAAPSAGGFANWWP